MWQSLISNTLMFVLITIILQTQLHDYTSLLQEYKILNTNENIGHIMRDQPLVSFSVHDYKQ